MRIPSDNQWPRTPVIDTVKPERLYVGKTNMIDITEDDGLTWEQGIPFPPPQYSSCCRLEFEALVATGQPGRLVLGVGFSENDAVSFSSIGGGIYTSTEYGVTWNYVSVSQVISPVISLAVDPRDLRTPLLVVAGEKDVLISDDQLSRSTPSLAPASPPACGC